jgi:fructose-bisphosphate aldolase class I
MGADEMTASALVDTAAELLAGDRGILAMDESIGTCNRRLVGAGIEPTLERRREYRDLLVMTPGLGESIQGAILFDETIRQRTDTGALLIKTLMDAGIIPGIKVDRGTVALAGHPGERITEGLDGLRDRLIEYRNLGARFAKWRAVFSIADGTPSCGCVMANADALARYAALCQEVGLVPIVEPEVLMLGDHPMARCGDITEAVLRTVFLSLHQQGVILEGLILKPNMVLPGATCTEQPTVEEVADATFRCLLRAVPAAVPGIAFLSGGQSGELASARLNAVNLIPGGRAPWALGFSFGRALQQPALDAWHGEDANVTAAQQALRHRANCDQMARRGEYTAALEKTGRTMESSVA